jgi:hypothetical protein
LHKGFFFSANSNRPVSEWLVLGKRTANSQGRRLLNSNLEEDSALTTITGVLKVLKDDKLLKTRQQNFRV